jgi:toxin HigB-1
LHISFETKALRTTCEKRDSAIARYGEHAAGLLRTALSDIRAADSISELGANITVADDHLVVPLADDVQAIFLPVLSAAVARADGVIDWARVNRLKLVAIGGKDG